MTMRLIICSALFMSFAHASNNGIFEAWKGFSSPEIMASGFTHTLRELPLEGHVQNGTKGWSSSYWPSKEGGINVRWNAPQKEGFDYSSPTLAQVKNMSLQELSMLSATEKYDLYTGQYDYPMKKLAATAADRRAPDWAGICHGWAPAAINHNEPTPKIVTNPDGIQIPFGSADIKGLISYYYAHHHETKDGSHQMGLRCFFGRWMGGNRSCKQDLNAGAFHIVISNMLGLRHEAFLVDIDRYKEVWNQPVAGYKSVIIADNLKPSPNAAKNAVKEIKVQTEFFYVNESENLTWEVAFGTKEQIIAKKDYVYTLEIDAAGKIVGGEWESDERPDFLWNKVKADKIEGILSRVTDLLND